MKRLSTLIMALCVIVIAANAIVISNLSGKLDKMNGRLDQLEMQLAGVRNSMNGLNSVKRDTEIKQKDVFTPSELAQYLGVNMSKIYDLIDAKGIGLPYVCIDGEYRFGREAIDEWLKSNSGTIIGN